MIVRELLTYLGFDLNETGFKRAEGGFKSLVGLAAELIDRVGEVKDRLFGLAVASAQSANEARKTGLKYGLTAEEVQELGFASSGTTELSAELQAALEHLGGTLGATGQKARPTIGLLESAAARVKALKTPAAQSAEAVRLLGESGAELLPFLLELDKRRQLARDVGAVFASNADAAAAKVFLEDVLLLSRQISTAFGAIWHRLGIQLLPVFHKLTDDTLEFLAANRALIDRGIKLLVRVIDKLVDGYIELKRIAFENQRFLAALALVVTSIVVPALIKMGLAWTFAGIRALLAEAPFIALALLVAAVAEDVYVFLTGGQSLIGNFFDEFLNKPEDPNDHWMVKTLRTILFWLRETILAVNGWIDAFDVEKSATWGEALKKVFTSAVTYWKTEIAAFVEWAIGEMKRIPRAILGKPGELLQRGLDLVKKPIELLKEPAERASGYVQTIRETISNQSPASRPLFNAATAGAGAPSIILQGGAQEFNFELTPGARAEDIAEQTGEAVRKANEVERRETARQLQSRVVR